MTCESDSRVFEIKMSLPLNVRSLLEQLRLLAMVVNEGWAVIKRREYIDLVIDRQPYNSVEVFYHTVSKRTIVRVWGRTVYDRECSDLAEEVKRAFSTKPCLGTPGLASDDLEYEEMDLYEMPVRRYSSKKCNTWTTEMYSIKQDGRLGPAVCNQCEKISNHMDWNLSNEPLTSTVPVLEVEVKAETGESCGETHEGEAYSHDIHSDDEEVNEEDNVTLDGADSHSVTQASCEELPLGDINNLAQSLFDSEATEGKTDLPSEDIMSAKEEDDTSTLSVPIVVIQREAGGTLEIVHAKEVDPEHEYKGASPPFDDREVWLKMLFPEEYNQCLLCTTGFKKLDYLWHHLQFEHTFDWYQCPECHVWRNCPEDILSHCDKIHKTREYDFKCPCCGMRYLGSEFEDHTIRCFETRYSNGDLSEYGLSQERLKKKILAREAHYKCTFCDKVFMTRSGIKHHKMHMHKDKFKGYICSDCDEVFPNSRSRQKHINQVHLNRSYKCDQCDKQFPLKDGLMQHIEKTHAKGSRRVQCQICSNWYADRHKMRVHVRCVHSGEKIYKCNFCDMRFSYSKARIFHKTIKHCDSWEAEMKRREWISLNRNKDPSEFIIKCHLCEEFRATIDDIRAHWQEAHPGKTDIPQERTYVTESGKERKIQAVDDSYSICTLCGEQLKSRGMSYHMHHAHPESYQAAFECETCGKRLANKNSLENHILAKHTPGGKDIIKYREAKSVCQICGKAVQKMEHHMRIHDETANRPKECTYCGKQFTTFSSMNCHRRVAHRDQWIIDRDRLLVEEGSMYLPGSRREAQHKKHNRRGAVKKSCQN